MRHRSVLFTPGTRTDRVAKALGGPADIVVADLEDAVPPGRKEAARAAVARLLVETPGAQARRAVRINAWPGPGEADLDAVMAGGPDLIVVPKAEDPGLLAALAGRIHALEHLHAIPEGTTRVLAILETARGVLQAASVADAPRVDVIAFGAEDLAADAGMHRTRGNGEVRVPRSLVALAAAAAGIQAIDMITADYRDLDRMRREAEEARGLGYAGKMCLHPAQVDVAHDVWRPSTAELAWARKVVAAVEAEGMAAGGVVVVDGRMIDVPLVRQARKVLDQA